MTTSLVTAILTLTGASAAFGQYNLGDGRKLDNNLRQGSGGINSPQIDQRLQYNSYQDAIITGNVTGLSRFRGRIDYRAPGEFSGTLPSDRLYEFERQSLPGAPINDYQRRQLGRVDSPYDSPLQQAAIVLRDGSGVTAGDVIGQRGPYAQPNSLALRDEVNQLTATGRIPAATLTSTLLDPATSTVGLTVDPSGNLMRITASPLTGLRTVPMDDGLRTTLSPRDTLTPRIGAGDDGTVPLVDPKVEGVPLPDAGDAPERDPDDLSQAPPLVRTPRLNDRLATEQAKPFDDRIGASRIEPSPTRTGELIAASSNWRDAKPGEDVYVDVLRRLGHLKTADADRVRKPGDEVVALEREPGTEVAALPKRPEPGAEPAAPDRNKEDDQLVEKLTAQIERGDKAIESLVGSGATGFDRAMSDAEAFMSKGEYFKAEDAYVSAMRLKPGHPMAALGRIHAQIGAGLNLSAGANLRALLTAHPELIAMRYKGPLMPSGERMNEVLDRLTDSIAESKRSELPMLAAYLGYQMGNAKLVEQGLAAANQRRPGDRLTGVLRRVWTQVKPLAPEPESEPEPELKGDNPDDAKAPDTNKDPEGRGATP